MLYGFLAWIEDFEQKHYYICSLSGKTLPKERATASLEVTHPFASDRNIASNVKYDQYLKFKIGAAADKNKILFDLFNQHSFPSLKKSPELMKKSVESWTGLSAFLNPYFSFNMADHNEVL